MPRFSWQPDDLNDGEGESCDDIDSSEPVQQGWWRQSSGRSRSPPDSLSRSSPAAGRRDVGSAEQVPPSPGSSLRPFDRMPSPTLSRSTVPHSPSATSRVVRRTSGNGLSAPPTPSSPCRTSDGPQSPQFPRRVVSNGSITPPLASPATRVRISDSCQTLPPTPPTSVINLFSPTLRSRGAIGQAAANAVDTSTPPTPPAQEDSITKPRVGSRDEDSSLRSDGRRAQLEEKKLPPSRIPRPHKAVIALAHKPRKDTMDACTASQLASTVGRLSKLQHGARNLYLELEDRNVEVRRLRDALSELVGEASVHGHSSAVVAAEALIAEEIQTSTVDVTSPSLSSSAGRQNQLQMRRLEARMQAASTATLNVPALKRESPTSGYRGRSGSAGTRSAVAIGGSSSSTTPWPIIDVKPPSVPPTPQADVDFTWQASESEMRDAVVRAAERERDQKAERRREQDEQAEQLRMMQAELAKAKSKERQLLEQVETMRKDRQSHIEKREQAETRLERSRMLLEDACSRQAEVTQIDVCAAITPASYFSALPTPQVIPGASPGVQRENSQRRTTKSSSQRSLHSEPTTVNSERADFGPWLGRPRSHRRGSPSPHTSPRAIWPGIGSPSSQAVAPTPPRTPPAPGTPAAMSQAEAEQEAQSLLSEMFSLDQATPSSARSPSKVRRSRSPRAPSTASASTEPPVVRMRTMCMSPSPASSSNSTPSAPPPQEKPMLLAINGCMPSFPSAELRDDGAANFLRPGAFNGNGEIRRRSCPVFPDNSRRTEQQKSSQQQKQPVQTSPLASERQRKRLEGSQSFVQPKATPRFDPSEVIVSGGDPVEPVAVEHLATLAVDDIDDTAAVLQAAPSPEQLDDFFLGKVPRLYGEDDGTDDDLRGRLSGIASAVARAMGSPEPWSISGAATHAPPPGHGGDIASGNSVATENPPMGCGGASGLPPRSPVRSATSTSLRSSSGGHGPARGSVVCRSPPTSSRNRPPSGQDSIHRSWSQPCAAERHDS